MKKETVFSELTDALAGLTGALEGNNALKKSKDLNADLNPDFKTGKVDNMVSQPDHYAAGKVECIDAMVSAFGRDNVNIYAEISAFKYVWRMNRKNTTSEQDKRKAIWYLRYSLNEDPRQDKLPQDGKVSSK
jgi:hypothetical protein|tara:strand:- start:294 stop:689 length:396 start_codon:yes stop_codon:yes gene_type:complete